MSTETKEMVNPKLKKNIKLPIAKFDTPRVKGYGVPLSQLVTRSTESSTNGNSVTDTELVSNPSFTTSYHTLVTWLKRKISNNDFGQDELDLINLMIEFNQILGGKKIYCARGVKRAEGRSYFGDYEESAFFSFNSFFMTAFKAMYPSGVYIKKKKYNQKKSVFSELCKMKKTDWITKLFNFLFRIKQTKWSQFYSAKVTLIQGKEKDIKVIYFFVCEHKEGEDLEKNPLKLLIDKYKTM